MLELVTGVTPDHVHELFRMFTFGLVLGEKLDHLDGVMKKIVQGLNSVMNTGVLLKKYRFYQGGSMNRYYLHPKTELIISPTSNTMVSEHLLFIWGTRTS